MSAGIPDPGSHGIRSRGSEFEGFKKILLVSIAIHVAIASLGLVFVKDTKKIFITPSYTVEIIEAPPVKKAKTKVKKKAPPTKTKTKTKKTIVKKKAAESVSIEDALSKIRREVQEKDEDELISSRIDRLLEELSKKEAQEQPDTKKTTKDTPKKVNVVPTANERITREMFQDKLTPYYNKIGAMIQSSWIFPGEATELETLFSITISRSGKLLRVGKEKGSGNILFDESGLRAINKSTPFPPLPDFVEGSSLEIGLRFCPECADKEN